MRILQKGCENIINVKQNLVLNGKNTRFNRVLVLSDVYFLLFEQEKWSKNNLILLFWSSLNNIEKIQKVKDNKTLILHWTAKEKVNPYLMSLVIADRESFIQDLLEKMKTFGMNFDIMKINKNNEVEHNSFSSSTKFQVQSSDEKIHSQNAKLMKYIVRKKKENENENDNNEEEEEEEEGEEEEDEEGEEEEDDEQEKEDEKKEDNKGNENEKVIKKKDKDEQDKNDEIKDYDKNDELKNENNSNNIEDGKKKDEDVKIDEDSG